MPDSDSAIKLINNRWNFMHIFFFIGLLFVSFGIGSLIWPGILYLLFIFFGFLFFISVLFLLFIIVTAIECVDAVVNQQYPENLDYQHTDHDALIIVHSMGVHGIGQYSGINNLINHFIEQEIPFKIYHCYNPDDFIIALRNRSAKYVWIFAHGWRGGVAFKWGEGNNIRALINPKTTIIAYESLEKMTPSLPKKHFIAQLHCNHLSKRSLEKTPIPAILIENPSEQDYYVTDGHLDYFTIWFATRELVTKIKRTPISAAETNEQGDKNIV